MTVRELRQKYLEFFESKAHMVYPSGSLIPIDVTGKLDESLLFNGAGMIQFKPFFRGSAVPPRKLLTTAQKCVRTGDIESVGDLNHLTFFEMMGNFSFGEYFKEKAIALSWEFLTSPKWLALDPKRLSFTVFEDDDEAFDNWTALMAAQGLNARVFRLDEETNYWPAGAFSNGPPGPCGPNSEMFYWMPKDIPPPGENYTVADWKRDDAAGNWLEIWNDVFIQFEWKGHLKNPERPNEGYVKEALEPLPFRSVDTGMGLERTTVVLNGQPSVYDTDAFAPIIRKIEDISGGRVKYSSVEDPDSDLNRSVRIIADHIRTACFCIADGVLPANNGRGYVLRRLIRRAVLKGQRVLGFDKPFFHLVFDGVIEAMGSHYQELIERRDVIVETLKNEEALFRRTLLTGYAEFMQVLKKGHKGDIENPADFLRLDANSGFIFPGDQAFKLYDTFGFPLEVTTELCEEAGIVVDQDGYEKALAEAQERSRGSSEMDTVYSEQEELVLVASGNAKPQSVFVGYDRLEYASEIVQISPRFGPDGKTNGEFQICLAETPFYAESGGQVGDTGSISGETFAFKVTKTWKEMGLIWHDAELIELKTPGLPSSLTGLGQGEITDILQSGIFFEQVLAHVDHARRKSITRNHSATHLLHAALRQVLGKHVTQAGSLVAPDHLRFDFTHGKAMTQEELARVEEIVNQKALEGNEVHIYVDIPIDQAKKKGAMALFGEKYGDKVRMVEMGDFSLELCGGCHVRQTSEVGLFRILSESSAASGVRRIEAITGEKAYDWARHQYETIKQAAAVLKSSPQDLVHAAEKAVDALREERKRAERLRASATNADSAQVEQIGELELVRQKLTEGDMKEATQLADRLSENAPNRVVLVGIVVDGKVSFIGKVGKNALAKGAHAGNLVREVAKIAEGGGGGRPDFATAGGRNPAKIDDALAAVKDIVAAQVG